MKNQQCTTCVWARETIYGRQDFCYIICGREGHNPPSPFAVHRFPGSDEQDILDINNTAAKQGMSYGQYVAQSYLSAYHTTA